MSSRLSQFAGQKYLYLETYRKNGEAVRTPVWFVESDGTLFVRTSEETGKYKRIRNNPGVQIAPCNSRGRPKGVWVRAEAKTAGKDDSERAFNLLAQKYGIMYRMMGTFLRGKDYVILEIRLADG
jgi:PPOX class probable F420-dependent enzyme